jgi:hypothetical protein
MPMITDRRRSGTSEEFRDYAVLSVVVQKLCPPLRNPLAITRLLH